MEQVNTSKSALLTVVIATTFMGPFMVSGVNIILPAIGREFSVSAVLLSWVANAYLLSTAVMLVPMAIATMFLAVLIGSEPINPRNHESFLLSVRLGLAICCMLCLIGIYFSYTRGSIHAGQTS